MNPFYQKDGITIYHGDQSEILPQLVNVDTVITDPPYGIGYKRGKRNNAEYAGGIYGRDWDYIKGDDKPFDPSHLINYPRCVLWGANNYAHLLPPVRGWLVWDKTRGGKTSKNYDMSQADLAWTNLPIKIQIFEHLWDGFKRASEVGEHLHPTQKPVALMKWCIEKAKPQGVIVDPYFGSGSLLVAARDLGFQAIGIEAEIEYCRVAVSRLAQQTLFTLPNNRLHLDVGDSPAQQALFTPEADTAEGKLPAPAPRR